MKTVKWIFATLFAMLMFNVFAQVADTISVGGYVLGDLSINKLIGGYIFVIIGLILKWIYFTTKAVKSNERTPGKFSFGYWVKDNLLTKITSFIGSALAVFIVFRFAEQYIGQALTMFGALGVGLGLDYYIDKAKNMLPDVAKNKETQTKTF